MTIKIDSLLNGKDSVIEPSLCMSDRDINFVASSTKIHQGFAQKYIRGSLSPYIFDQIYSCVAKQNYSPWTITTGLPQAIPHSADNSNSIKLSWILSNGNKIRRSPTECQTWPENWVRMPTKFAAWATPIPTAGQSLQWLSVPPIIHFLPYTRSR